MALIQSPPGWLWDRLNRAALSFGSATPEEYWPQAGPDSTHPTVRRISVDDVRDALARGYEDFSANRTDVIFLCVMYPVLGLVLGRAASGYDLLPLLFPLASGFALVGPFAAVGLNEMSRRREQGASVRWIDAFGVLRSPSIGSIILLGMLLMGIFLIWLEVADVIYKFTLGPDMPASIGAFLHDVFATSAGWALIVVGMGIGFLFAVLVLAISVVSFPLLLDRNVGIETAVRTSIRAVMVNPGVMAVWGLIVAVSLVVGSIPFFLGLVVVLPVLGHATWHLYRKAIPR
ncbi:DUF2189 domain-containing protein [Limobrevibacterium gyesilva]|uniref:DUF2189 domain-containing protein n=1 Tax=Limobrevibacterium gyesilva TaxID=2991712 RepID=A0AA41YNW3_9PROT|nr:DUF2189 domain-containing protein [Limobrevibacterium gyesilva]MCW3476175.1 DUF2189 domain-containing protein [Limobrevibacterium gyesilva]